MTLNFASSQQPDEYLSKQILRYLTIAFSVFCEYLACDTDRIRRAAFSALRLLVTHGLKVSFFRESGAGQEKASGKLDIESIMNLDAMTICEEVENIRNDRRSKKKLSAQEKFLIHICYLLSSRFETQYEHVLKLI